MPNDYIDQIKLTNNTVVDIKDTVSGYITSSDMPITIIEGALGIPSLTLTLTGVTYQELHTIMSSGRTVVIRADVSTYGVMYVLVSECVHYGSNYAVGASLPINMTEEGVGTTSFHGESSESSDIVVLSPTSIVVQEKLTFNGTYNASTNKAATVSTVTNAINALDGGTIGTGSTTKTITSLSQSNGNVSATFSDIAFPVTSVNGQTGAVTTAEKFVIAATAISGTEYYNLDKTYADILNAIGGNKYVSIQDMDATYPYTTITTQGVVFGATLLATSNGQLMAITDGILVTQSGSTTLGMAVHSSTVLPTMSDIPSASSTTPSMDGTAAVGTGTTWARADHVHPTDTSRQATLVSGTNIKTINNESILGSGNISISAGSGDTLIATVTFTGTQYTESYSCDTTYDSLYNALSSGRDVILRYKDTSSDNNLYNFFLSEGFNTIYSGDTLYFSRVTDNGEIHRFSVTNTDYWAYSSYKIASTKVDALDSTSKLYLVGAKNQQSSVTSYSNSDVYATNGVLNAKSFSVDASANIVYNSSSKSIDFTFV